MRAHPFKKLHVCGVLVFLVLLLCLTSTPVFAATDSYFYPGYDAASTGCVDLMKYVRQVTLTINGQTYTGSQLRELESLGTPVSAAIGDTVAFNFDFSLQGRAYNADDPTLLDPAASVHVTYPRGSNRLSGETVSDGQEAILDDSSLVLENSSRENSFLRFSLDWLRSACGELRRVTSGESGMAFSQVTENGTPYLYVYFPGGLGQNIYAAPGSFTLELVLTNTLSSITIPVEGGYFTPEISEWRFPLQIALPSDVLVHGSIRSYGDIIVRKEWVSLSQHPDSATVVLSYNQNGQPRTASRVLTTEQPAARFTIQNSMTDCVLTEDMTGLDNYTSTLRLNETSGTYTFTNTEKYVLLFSKRAEGESQELAGSGFRLYRQQSGQETMVESWTSSDAPHPILLQPGDFRLHEVSAPKGYAVAPDILFTLNPDNTVTLTSQSGTLEGNILICSDPCLSVKLVKIDEFDQALPGATLQLLDKTADLLVDEWVSTADPHKIVYQSERGVVLVAGHTYLLHEVSAPDGFQSAADIAFVFNGDGTIPQHGYRTVTMTDLSREGFLPNQDADPSPDPDPNLNPSPDPSGGADSSASRQPHNPLVQTGDSPLLWLYLALGIGCIAAGLLLYRHARHTTANRQNGQQNRNTSYKAPRK